MGENAGLLTKPRYLAYKRQAQQRYCEADDGSCIFFNFNFNQAPDYNICKILNTYNLR